MLKNNGLGQVEVSAMGSCDKVGSAAQALVRAHPSYYFVIDRDDQDQNTVEKSWSNFPNPDTHNMLIWRKRELENYFIDPEYIEKSAYIKVSGQELRKRILDEANRRLFLDAANLTLSAIKRGIRGQFPSDFRDTAVFQTEEQGMAQLESCPGLAEHKSLVDGLFENLAIREIYTRFVQELSGDCRPLQYGKGTWLERMSGKEIFRCIAGPCFQVKAADGRFLQGQEQSKQIARQLLRDVPFDEQPADFQQLFHLLKARVASTV